MQSSFATPTSLRQAPNESSSKRVTVGPRLGSVLILHSLIVCLLLALCYVSYEGHNHSEDVIRPYCFLQMALLIWMAWSWKRLNGSVFDPYMLFVFAAAMFHTGQMALECLNLNGGQMLSGLFPPEVLLRTVLLVLLSFAFLHLGALLSMVPRKRKLPVRAAGGLVVPKLIEAIGWALFAVSVLPAILVLKNVVAAAMAGGYFFALFAHEGATGFAGILNFLAAFLIPSALFLLAGSRGRRIPLLLSAAIVFLYGGVYLFVGGRTIAAVSGSVYAWMWDRLVRPIPRALVVAVAVVCLFVIFPLVAVVRDKGGASRLSMDYLTETWSSMERPAAASLEETGGSLITVGYTLELVPALRDFDKGKSYAMALLTVVPNLFWDKHPSVAYGTPGNWMLSMVDPHTADAGGGLGYSFIAEAYFNFGWFGPLAIGLLGFMLGRFVGWVKECSDPLRCVCVANMLLPLLWYTRNESSGAVRDILWLGVAPYLLIRFLAGISLGARPAGESFVPSRMRASSALRKAAQVNRRKIGLGGALSHEE